MWKCIYAWGIQEYAFAQRNGRKSTVNGKPEEIRDAVSENRENDSSNNA